MGIFELLKSRRSDDNGSDADNEVDHYVVRHMPWDGKGGFRRLQGWTDLGDPITRQEFEYNVADLDPGRYRLFGVDEEGNLVSLPDEEAWVWEVGNPAKESEKDVAPKVKQLEQEIEEINDLLGSIREENESSSDPLDETRPHVLEAMVTDEDFMAQHGKKVFKEFVLADSSEWNDEDLNESDSGSSVFADLALDIDQTPDDVPQEEREKSETSSDDLDSYISGLVAGARDEGNPERQEVGTTEDNGSAQLADINGGPDSIDDLEVSEIDETDQVASELS